MATMVPSEVISNYVISTVGAFNAVTSSSWPMFRSHLPDGVNVPDNAVCIYDTSGYLQAKDMRGTLTQRHGIQIVVRCTSYDVGYKKLANLLAVFEPIKNVDVAVGGSTFRIYNISQTSAIGIFGIEPDAKQRYFFSANLLVTMKEI